MVACAGALAWLRPQLPRAAHMSSAPFCHTCRADLRKVTDAFDDFKDDVDALLAPFPELLMKIPEKVRSTDAGFKMVKQRSLLSNKAALLFEMRDLAGKTAPLLKDGQDELQRAAKIVLANKENERYLCHPSARAEERLHECFSRLALADVIPHVSDAEFIFYAGKRDMNVAIPCWADFEDGTDPVRVGAVICGLFNCPRCKRVKALPVTYLSPYMHVINHRWTCRGGDACPDEEYFHKTLLEFTVESAPIARELSYVSKRSRDARSAARHALRRAGARGAIFAVEGMAGRFVRRKPHGKGWEWVTRDGRAAPAPPPPRGAVGRAALDDVHAIAGTDHCVYWHPATGKWEFRRT